MLKVMRKMAGRVAVGLTATLTLVVAMMAGAFPASASPGTTWGFIVNKNSNLCMAVAYGTMAPGSPVIQWGCTGTPDQYWNVPDDGNQGIFPIENYKDASYCLAGPGAFEGTQLTIEPCDGSADQQWGWWSSYIGRQLVYELVNQEYGYVAAVSAARTDQGAPVILWADQTFSPGGHPEQLWVP